ncbi:E3 ubiquitin-protein ligase ZNF598-like [Mizuhopecten yessoensis]|uniref:RING-type E3 ubiquitin transferase n=1 Tax=Mizuhopecten yessoensis TaxID=6573 RepID=A0A210R6I3_MIZYE|nr:E3 ubiquitin-protein ligase ZNF598-like [Mizuhopecten yessoensis]OWF56534.1 neutral ceramidase C [Mizuhopecten yessoensis]
MEKRQRRESATESCPVCHEAVEIYAIGSCDHPVCYRCALRMRALCNQFYCPICRTDLSQVYMVHNLVKESAIPRHGYIPNRKLKIFYEDDSIKKRVDKLLEHNCPKCKQSFRLFKELQTHMRKDHTHFYCDLCIVHLQIFPFERKYYSRQDLATHRRVGDKDDTSYKGHPLCHFCEERYMDNDELYRHLRKEHYYCHFCEKDGCNEYYGDYEDLKRHFRDQHYLCQDEDCVNAQFTHAFRSEIDLKAHKANEHNRGLTKAQVRQSRVVDVDIQLAPRKKPQRGVVSRDAYEDTGPRNRGRNGVSGRQASYRERFRDEDVEKAIKVSLETMKEDRTKQSKSPVEEMELESPKIVHDESNFPLLGNMPSGRPHTPTPTEELIKDRSIAHKLAKANHMSVQHGRLGMADFPSLGQSSGGAPEPPKPSGSRKGYHEPRVGASKSVSTVSNKNRPSSMQSVENEDFPGLPTAKNISSSNTSSKVGSWGVQPPPKPHSSVQQNKDITQNINVTLDSKVSKSKQYNVIPSKRVLVDDKEFPSLGNKPPLNLEWGNSSSENKKQPTSKKVDWFDVDEQEFSIHNFKSDKDGVHTDTAGKSKKKKKKQKGVDSTSDEKNSSSFGEHASLDNIASSLISAKSKPDPTELQKLKENKKPVSVKDSKDIKHVSDEEFKEYPVVTNSGKIELKERATVAVVQNHSTFNKFDLLGSEDFPQMANSMPKSRASEKPRKEKATLLLDEEEYPQLGGNKKSKAPPGFSKTPLPTSPPGFSTTPAPKKPPPGFGPSVKSESKQHEILDLHAIQESLTLKTIVPMSVNMGNFLYAPLEDSQSRNHKLISDIRSHAHDDFDKFKTWAGDFRNGKMLAASYYDKCERLLGKKDFTSIFPELLALLPDIDKQQELLSIYSSVESAKPCDKHRGGQGRKGGWEVSSFSTCPTCRQVLLQKDYNQHIAMHDTGSDFPSLHSDSSSRPVGLKEWVKAQ